MNNNPKTLLIIACRDGNEWLREFLMDPALVGRFPGPGWSVEERPMEEIDERHLMAADAVVFIQQPYVTNSRGTACFPRVEALLDDYLRRGGGLVFIFDDRYFQVFPNANRFLGRYGARIVQELLDDADPTHKTSFANDPLFTAITTRNINRDHAVCQDIESLRFPVEPAGGLTFPLELSDDWEVLVRGEDTAFSKAVWTDQSSSFPKAPPFAAARTVGNGGRLVVLASHSSLSLLNGCHARWDGGIILDGGMGRLLQNAVDWSSGSILRREGAIPVALPRTPHTPFPSVAEADQAFPARFQKGTCVVVPRRPTNLREWRSVAGGDAALAWLAVAIPGEGLSHEDHRSWVEQCARASDDSFCFLPAVQVEDWNGNPAVVVAPKKWPITRKLRTLNHILHNIQGHFILLSPDRNPWPAWNIGGFQGFALASFDEGRPVEFPLETYRLLQAGDWFLSPHTVDYADSPVALAKNLAGRRALTFVGADSPREVVAKLPQLFQNERHVYLSEGPVIGDFGLRGGGLVNDVWEGAYYLWRGPGDVATLELCVKDEAGLRAVRIFRDGQLWRQYRPNAVCLSQRIELQADLGSHCFWLEAENQNGGRTMSMVLRTRAPHYWGHGGGDRMNTYSGVSLPNPHKREVWVQGEWRANCGDVRFGLGWGSWIRVMPAVPNPDLLPVGREWDSPPGGIKNMFAAPRITVDGETEFIESKPRRIGYEISHEEAVILRESVSFVPIRKDGSVVIEASGLLRAEIGYRIPRWSAGGAVSFVVDVTVSAVKDLDLSPTTSLQLMEIQAESGRWFKNLTWDGGGGVRHEVLDSSGCARAEQVRWAAFWPDPLGALGIFGLDQHSYRVAVDTPDGQPPWLRFFAEIPAGVWKRDEARHFRYAFASGAPSSGDPTLVFQQIHRNWTQPGVRLTVGRRLPGAGVVEIELEQGMAVGEIEFPAGDASLLLRFAGAATSVPGFLLDRDSGEIHPLAGTSGEYYFTHVPGGRLSFVAGELVRLDRAELHVDVRRLGAGELSVWVHNPTGEAIIARIATNLPGAGVVRSLTIEAGADVICSFPLSK